MVHYKLPLLYIILVHKVMTHLYNILIPANENRYEGSWKNGKKNGPGKFFYLDKGQVYEGIWLEDVAKCGEMKDFGRHEAPDATLYPIPPVQYYRNIQIFTKLL